MYIYFLKESSYQNVSSYFLVSDKKHNNGNKQIRVFRSAVHQSTFCNRRRSLCPWRQMDHQGDDCNSGRTYEVQRNTANYSQYFCKNACSRTKKMRGQSFNRKEGIC